MTGNILDVVTKVGSFVGLLTGAFTLYDRTARGRPVADIIFTPLATI